MRKWLLIIAFMSLSVPAHAHKVIASAWLDGNDIEGEVGLSNGEMAKDGTLVEVFDDQDNKLGETTISTDGLFRFTPTKPVAHHFTANLGAGHVASVIVSRDELPDNLQSPKQTPTTSVPQKMAPSSPSVQSSDLKHMIAKVVRQEVQPLRKEIASYKEKNDLQSILGGIGYILGLTGVIFYIAAKRKEDKNK